MAAQGQGHEKVKTLEGEFEVLTIAKQIGQVSSRQIVGWSPAPTDLTTMTGDVLLTIAQLQTGVIHGDPGGAGRTLTFPTATLLLAGWDDISVGASLDIYIINQASADEPIEVAMGASGTLIGEGTVEAPAIATEESSGSAKFRLRVTNASTGAYSVYRLA